MKIAFIANNNIGSGLTGGDTIWVQLMKAWGRKDEVTLVGSEEAYDIARRKGLEDFPFIKTDTKNSASNLYTIAGLFLHYCRRLRKGMRNVREKSEFYAGNDAVYSVSDAYPDLFPAFFIKRKNPKTLWIAGYYLFVPHPFSKETPYTGRNWLRGALYWLMQLLSYRIVRRYADYVFVTSDPDVKHFVTSKRDKSKIIVVRGGVDITESEAYLSSGDIVPVEKRRFDACFLGRLHYQKGVIELTDIWRQVVNDKPDAKLAIIGDGPLEDEVKQKIKLLGLQSNIEMFGFLDGFPKIEVFKQSKMMLHPAIYDSGGMSAAEGMAWKLPGVAFDLEALRTYYPKGMQKAAKGDIQGFANLILRLLDDNQEYLSLAEEAHDLILMAWDWRSQSRRIYSQVFS